MFGVLRADPLGDGVLPDAVEQQVHRRVDHFGVLDVPAGGDDGAGDSLPARGGRVAVASPQRLVPGDWGAVLIVGGLACVVCDSFRRSHARECEGKQGVCNVCY